MPVQIEGDPWPQGQAVLQGFIPFAGVVPLQGLGLIGHAEVAEKGLAAWLGMLRQRQAREGAQGGGMGSLLGGKIQQGMAGVRQQQQGQGRQVEHLPAGTVLTGELLAEAAEPGVDHALLEELQGPASVEVALAAAAPGGMGRSGQGFGQLSADLQAQRAIARQPIALMEIAFRLE
jgi:hypothetical protein